MTTTASDPTSLLSETDPNSLTSDTTKSLKIAILGYRSNPYSGGQGIYIHYLSKALVDMGHQVHVISGEPYPHLDPRVKLITMPGLNLYERGLASIRLKNLFSLTDMIEWFSKLTGGFAEPYCFGRRVKAFLKKQGHDYDIVHDNQSLAYGMLSIQQDFPFITTLHHPITSDLKIALAAAQTLWQKILIKRWHSFLTMQNKVVNQLEHIITVSACSKKDIAADFGISEEKIELIYNGIDTEIFKPQPAITRKHQRLLATASADQPLKGLNYLLQAYAQLLTKLPELELIIVGKPKAGGVTEQLITELKLNYKVQFISGISTKKLVELYASATLAVVPSVYEGFGLPAGEAMACGVPVISTDGGALPEVVGDAGVIVPAKQPEALAKGVEFLLNSPEKQAQYAIAGRQRILEQFSWQVVAKKLTHYYYDVISAYANR